MADEENQPKVFKQNRVKIITSENAEILEDSINEFMQGRYVRTIKVNTTVFESNKFPRYLFTAVIIYTEKL